MAMLTIEMIYTGVAIFIKSVNASKKDINCTVSIGVNGACCASITDGVIALT